MFVIEGASDIQLQILRRKCSSWMEPVSTKQLVLMEGELKKLLIIALAG